MDDSAVIDNDDVIVTVETEFIGVQQDGDKDHYIFSYTITIDNQSEFDLQLLSRYWLITDGNAKISTVVGEGVIGEKPLIATGKKYKYSSGCALETPVGTMEGYYLMIDAEKQSYKVHIPVFRLAVPGILN
ncbi:Co2+/Mg2+ efflux protein ApaG [Thalassotalea fusca]